MEKMTVEVKGELIRKLRLSWREAFSEREEEVLLLQGRFDSEILEGVIEEYLSHCNSTAPHSVTKKK